MASSRSVPPKVDAALLRSAQAFRRSLHQNPEVSNAETETASRVKEFLVEVGLKPWKSGLGGTGLLYRLQGSRPGPNILLRADLDGLPIRERTGLAYASQNPEAHHACGHDGHMSMLAGALSGLARSNDLAGTVYGVFQPAEETGDGAKGVLKDLGTATPRFHRVYGIHNYPGIPLGVVGIRKGTAARASLGLRISMTGKRTHSSEPHRGKNPIPALADLAKKIQPKTTISNPFGRSSITTIVGIRSEGPNYGVSPAEASLHLTARGNRQPDLDRLLGRLEGQARAVARREGLKLSITQHEVFRETRNDVAAVKDVISSSKAVGLATKIMPHPLSASEDFGRFTDRWPGALILLGSGVKHPALHASTYDFPDNLLETGINLWTSLAQPRA